MNFKYLISREWKWWIASPAMWWSFPFVVLFFFLYFPVAITVSGMDIAEYEQAWQVYSQMWKMLSQQMLKDIIPFLPQEQVELIENIMAMTVTEIWSKAFIPLLKIFIFLPPISIFLPLGIRLLQRDINNGFIIQHLSHKGSIMSFFAAKWILNTLIASIIIFISMILFLHLMRDLSGHPELFQPTDPDWIITWFGVSLGFGASSFWLTWISFLLSRNGVTEYYISSVLCSVLLLALLALINKFGMERQGMIIISAIVWSSNLIYFLIMSWAVKRERFWVS